MKGLPTGLCAFLCTALAGAQPANAPAPAAPALDASTARAAALAKILNPAEYDPAFYTGAQAEFSLPRTGATGVSSLVVGYDAVGFQIDLSLGFGIGGDALADESAPEVYIAGIRMSLPIHRGIRADFSLMPAASCCSIPRTAA